MSFSDAKEGLDTLLSAIKTLVVEPACRETRPR